MVYDTIILGAGASGLMCARTLLERGKTGLVLEHNDRIGLKILASGGGRCNFTNRFIDHTFYQSENPHFVKSAISRFGFNESIELFSNSGVLWQEEEEGTIFCTLGSREALRPFASVKVKTGCKIISAHFDKENFVVKTSVGELLAKDLVIATGGLSYSSLGASSLGHKLAKSFGHTIVSPRPALGQLLWYDKDKKIFGKISGITVNAEVSVGKRSFSGGFLFTHDGLSGPTSYDASLFWKSGDTVSVRIFKGTDFLDVMNRKKTASSKQTLEVAMTQFIPRRLAAALFEYLGIENAPIASYPAGEFKKIIQSLEVLTFKPKCVDSYERAEATAGGVNTDEISSKTFESKKVPGLYFIGEVLDVTGIVGGYNLHFAFASGYCAGLAM